MEDAQARGGRLDVRDAEERVDARQGSVRAVAEQVLVVDEQAVGRGVVSRDLGGNQPVPHNSFTKSFRGARALAPSSGEEPDRHAIERCRVDGVKDGAMIHDRAVKF